MATFIQNLMGSQPHSLETIRDSLGKAFDNDTDFIALLKEHHDYLEESISVLMDNDATDADKQSHLIRFFRLLEMHGKSEQETLYISLKKNKEKEARLEGFGGQDEHDVAFQLEEELLAMGYLNDWNEEIAAKGKVVAGLVQKHIKEEESEMFPIAQNDIDESELEMLRDQYVTKCKTYLDESAVSAGQRDLNARAESPTIRI
jgi:hemerythrin-like domain-containing protein